MGCRTFRIRKENWELVCIFEPAWESQSSVGMGTRFVILDRRKRVRMLWLFRPVIQKSKRIMRR